MEENPKQMMPLCSNTLKVYLQSNCKNAYIDSTLYFNYFYPTSINLNDFKVCKLTL